MDARDIVMDLRRRGMRLWVEDGDVLIEPDELTEAEAATILPKKSDLTGQIRIECPRRQRDVRVVGERMAQDFAERARLPQPHVEAEVRKRNRYPHHEQSRGRQILTSIVDPDHDSSPYLGGHHSPFDH